MTSRRLKADTLAVGVSVVLIMTVVQRGVGFMRGIWFCRLLDEPSLGRWAMAFGFLSLVTPMMLLGIPGSLPRFIELYLQQRQLAGFLRRILALTALVSSLAVFSMLVAPGLFGKLVFDDSGSIQLVFALALAVGTVILFNVTNEILAGLRLVRLGATNQFINSVAFTVLGGYWLASGGQVAGLLVMFALSCLIGAVPGWWAFLRSAANWSTPEASEVCFPAKSMWGRVLPYAAALWSMNLLSNAFELADRYMLLHFTNGGPETGQRFLGQYHSSLIIPYLFISLANMGASMLTPYLVVDWEKGEKEQVAQKLERFLMMTATMFTAAAAVALVCCPWIFDNFLQGRYSEGLNVMPMCFVFSVWFAISTLAQAYLWVSERGKLVAIVMAVGLATNIAANAILVPRVGLDGAVWGTLLSHFVVLVGSWWAIGKSGFRLDSTTVWMTILPATLIAGPAVALAATVATVCASPKLRRYSAAAISAAGCQFRVFAR